MIIRPEATPALHKRVRFGCRLIRSCDTELLMMHVPFVRQRVLTVLRLTVLTAKQLRSLR